MRPLRFSLALLVLSMLGAAANASFEFSTNSTADQVITSPLVDNGSIPLHSTGIQTFTVDLAAGTANVVSDFKGHDFLTPFGSLSYDLYNTQTVGTSSIDSNGLITIRFSLLFELKVTSDPLKGTVFETLSPAIFQNTVSSLPFPIGSVFGDPNLPNDAVPIFLQKDPTGILASLGVATGAPIGTSSSRVVTTLRVVPEPSALVSLVIGVAFLGVFGLRKASARRASQS